MKKLTFLVAILGSFSVAHASSVLDQTYVSVKLGASIAEANDLHNKYDNVHNDYSTLTSTYGNGLSRKVSEDDTVFTGSIAYGYAFETAPVRAELEYTFRNKSTLNPALWTNRNTEAEVRTQNLMANVYYDFKNSSSFTPYVSAGLGASFNKLNVTESVANVVTERANDKKTDFAWSVGLGLNYEISKNLDLDFAYRYMDSGKVNATHNYREIGYDYDYSERSNYDTKLKNHDFTVGLRYNF